MTTDVQDAGAATNEAGGQQEVDAASTAAAAGTASEGEVNAGKPAEATGEAKGEGKDDAGKPAETAELDVKFEMPEGVELDSAAADEFKAVIRDKSLTDAQRYQKLADLAVKREQARFDSHRAQVEKWADEVAKDKELGKPENQALAVKVVDNFGTPVLKQMLERSGLGNHPELVRFVLKIGRAMSEDTIVNSRTTAPSGPRDAASILYGTPSK